MSLKCGVLYQEIESLSHFQITNLKREVISPSSVLLSTKSQTDNNTEKKEKKDREEADENIAMIFFFFFLGISWGRKFCQDR